MTASKQTGYELKVYPCRRAREVYRVFQISGDATFDELCAAILNLFDFDASHLYQFCMNDNIYDDDNLQCPYCEDCGPRDTSNTTLDDVGLSKGTKFLFHYDFGDNWMFNITVAKVLDDFSSSDVIIIREKGKLSQYCDEDEELDE